MFDKDQTPTRITPELAHQQGRDECLTTETLIPSHEDLGFYIEDTVFIGFAKQKSLFAKIKRTFLKQIYDSVLFCFYIPSGGQWYVIEIINEKFSISSLKTFQRDFSVVECQYIPTFDNFIPIVNKVLRGVDFKKTPHRSRISKIKDWVFDLLTLSFLRTLEPDWKLTTKVAPYVLKCHGKHSAFQGIDLENVNVSQLKEIFDKYPSDFYKVK